VNHCKTCKHWGDDRSDTETVYRTCQRVPHEEDHTHDGATPYVIDWEEYNASLVTPPDFGCVLWEAENATRSMP
jgi:hypothetical protein